MRLSPGRANQLDLPAIEHPIASSRFRSHFDGSRLGSLPASVFATDALKRLFGARIGVHARG